MSELVRAGVRANLATMDFGTREGCVGYVEGFVLPPVLRSYLEHRGAFMPFGVVLVRRVNGKQLPAVQPTVIPCAPGHGITELRAVMRKASETMDSLGSVLVFKSTDAHRQITVVVAQLEHASFPDILWTARVMPKGLDAWAGPVDVSVCTPDVKPLRFLAARWKS